MTGLTPLVQRNGWSYPKPLTLRVNALFSFVGAYENGIFGAPTNEKSLSALRKGFVPKTGLEPAHPKALRPEHSASTNFATWAFRSANLGIKLNAKQALCELFYTAAANSLIRCSAVSHFEAISSYILSSMSQETDRTVLPSSSVRRYVSSLPM